MARKTRSLSDAFEKLAVEKPSPETKQENITDKSVHDVIEENVIDKQNTIHEQENVTQKRNTFTEQKTTSELQNSSIKDVAQNILELFDEKSNKKTVEETHIRRTYLIRRDLDKKLNKISKNKKKGFKTLLLNQALETILSQFPD